MSIFSLCTMPFVFKYFNFFNADFAALAAALQWNYSIEALSIARPIGLSFHTFQSLSYVIEVYRGRQKAEHHLRVFALYVMYLPQLVAGPHRAASAGAGGIDPKGRRAALVSRDARADQHVGRRDFLKNALGPKARTIANLGREVVRAVARSRGYPPRWQHQAVAHQQGRAAAVYMYAASQPLIHGFGIPQSISS
jgi:hypothetical protein